jgi:hypothetical protein
VLVLASERDFLVEHDDLASQRREQPSTCRGDPKRLSRSALRSLVGTRI